MLSTPSKDLWQSVGLTPVSYVGHCIHLQHKTTGALVKSFFRDFTHPQTINTPQHKRESHSFALWMPSEGFSAVHLKHLGPILIDPDDPADPMDPPTRIVSKKTTIKNTRKQVENYKIALHNLKNSPLWETLITQEAAPMLPSIHISWRWYGPNPTTQWELKARDTEILIISEGVPCGRPTQFKTIQKLYAAANIDLDHPPPTPSRSA